MHKFINKSIWNRFLKRETRENTIENNCAKWSDYDWSRKGEEWSNNPAWKKSFIHHVLERYVPAELDVLEIGPGAGRWTEHLAPTSRRLFLVDLTPRCIEICRERFGHLDHVDFFINDGKHLKGIEDQSIDRIWSWDVFVHIQSTDIRCYIDEFRRVLRKSGLGIIHHAKSGRNALGWRSNMTDRLMVDFCLDAGLEVVDQFDSWDDGKFWIWPDFVAGQGPDIVTVFRKPN